MHLFIETTAIKKIETKKLESKFQKALLLNVSHELWTPLNIILRGSDITLNSLRKLALKTGSDSDLCKAIKWSKFVYNSSGQLYNFVNDIIDLNLIENE